MSFELRKSCQAFDIFVGKACNNNSEYEFRMEIRPLFHAIHIYMPGPTNGGPTSFKNHILTEMVLRIAVIVPLISLISLSRGKLG